MTAALVVSRKSSVAGTSPETRLIVVGGVPGAGKTTAIAVVAREPGVRVLDPDQIRDRLKDLLPAGTLYRRYRSLVHLTHWVRVLIAVLTGPSRSVLVVHDPANRPVRRKLLVRLARGAGWQPTLLLIDVPRAAAETGQLVRGRVVKHPCFEGHWRRWSSLRAEITGGGGPLDSTAWVRILMVDRSIAAATLSAIAAGRPTPKSSNNSAAGGDRDDGLASGDAGAVPTRIYLG
ncbi:MAG: ATP-binding protein [Microlunatus sp.]|nr:ATP-binding protein [Microlunatus sp.]MDN5771207.1 ATP-binding protein [Microlunatus sp.]